MKRIGKGTLTTAKGLFFLSAGLLLLTGTAHALSTSTNMDVTANVPGNVTVTATALNFGALSSTTVTSATSTITVNAPVGTSFNITLDVGLHPAGGVRTVTDGTTAIPYFLFQESTYTTEWGDSDYGNTYSAGASRGPENATGADQVFTVYGQIDPYGGGNSPGTYTDTVTVTVHY